MMRFNTTAPDRTLSSMSVCFTVMVFLCVTVRDANSADRWALIERFSGNPSSPSQALLPENFDYVVTHRTEPKEQFSKLYAPYPADHDENCAPGLYNADIERPKS